MDFPRHLNPVAKVTECQLSDSYAAGQVYDMGYSDVEINSGNQIQTPNLKRLAKAGTILRRSPSEGRQKDRRRKGIWEFAKRQKKISAIYKITT